ncbi:transposase [Thiohalocapsa halophila]|uniref:Transposase n=1 Tax=Thiohalocapsa halophila TaxID=69359 RepID=A0ABS1CPU6_9GAMM|nr:IS1634 family transposase [Thiohalocapsa halophila]MBK1633951.1 transposase [Thiohalocapsa halophila]
MYIRRTTIKSRRSGEPYFTYRLVESIREGGRVRQRTLLNLGRHFEVPQAQWPALAQRIEALVGGQAELFVADLDARWEQAAQHYAAQVIRARAGRHEGSRAAGDYHSVDVGAVEVVRPRSVAVEHVALSALRQVGLDEQLTVLGFNGPQRAAAIGTLIGRMVAPGSELATHHWLQQRSALGELIDFDFTTLDLMALYRISDRLLAHKPALEAFLYERERDLFDLDEVITLYDLTNTYFEGTAHANANAAFGKSKEKRTDRPLVTLALVLDASGFPKRSRVFAGNAAEAQTLAEMVQALAPQTRETPPTVVLDAGIATEDNIAWLNEQGYRYVVVSRRRHRQFDPDNACLIKEDGALTIRAQRVVNDDTGEVELYCHSTQREQKERGIAERFAQRFEAKLQKLADGLHKPRTVKRYEKVLEAIGRLKQKYPRAAQYYEISVEQDETGPNAKAIHWQRVTPVDDTLPGVYCLRTNQTEWDERTLWQTYVTLTDLEAVFRSLKSELGLRPVYHHKTDRVSGHLFISVLAYHLVHTIRLQLQACGIHLSWEGIRRELDGQDRVTVELKREDGRTVHVRKATRAEPRQQLIYDALGISDRPGQQQITVV